LEAVFGCWTTELRSVICRISDTWRNSLVLKPSSTRIRTGDLLDKVANKWLTTLVTGLARMTVATGDQRSSGSFNPRGVEMARFTRGVIRVAVTEAAALKTEDSAGCAILGILPGSQKTFY
jgi:hypothetical protein